MSEGSKSSSWGTFDDVVSTTSSTINGMTDAVTGIATDGTTSTTEMQTTSSENQETKVKKSKKHRKDKKEKNSSKNIEDDDAIDEETSGRKKKKKQKKSTKDLEEMEVAVDSVENIFSGLNGLEKLRLMMLISKVQARFRSRIERRKFEELKSKTTESVARQNLIEVEESSKFQTSGGSGNRGALLDLLNSVQSTEDLSGEEELIIAKFGQSHYRRWKGKQKYQRILEERLHLIALLQSSQIRIKRNHKRKVEAATYIQKHRRGNLDRRKYEVLKLERMRNKAATTIQSLYRGHEGRERVRRIKYFNNTVKLSFLLACAWKGYSTRQMFQMMIQQMNRKKMVIKIENCYLEYRRWNDANERRRYQLWELYQLHRKQQATVIQKWWRKIFFYYKFQYLIAKKREKEKREKKERLRKRVNTLKTFKKVYQKQLEKEELIAEEQILLRLKAQRDKQLQSLSM